MAILASSVTVSTNYADGGGTHVTLAPGTGSVTWSDAPTGKSLQISCTGVGDGMAVLSFTRL